MNWFRKLDGFEQVRILGIVAGVGQIVGVIAFYYTHSQGYMVSFRIITVLLSFLICVTFLAATKTP